ncbi:MAG: hypothetical protein WD534_04260 [Phycisphaeraceae bacterium]
MTANDGDPIQPTVNPLALSIEQAARLLKLPEATVREHVSDGAPTAADGTLNLIHYAAWLNQQLKRRSDGPAEH